MLFIQFLKAEMGKHVLTYGSKRKHFGGGEAAGWRQGGGRVAAGWRQGDSGSRCSKTKRILGASIDSSSWLPGNKAKSTLS